MTKALARWIESVDGIEPDGWRSLFADAPEGLAYFRACERAPPPSFSLSAIAAFEDQRIAAVAPLFQTTIHLDRILDGVAQRAIGGLGKLFPSVSCVPLVGIGSPYLDDSSLAFDAALDSGRRLATLDTILQEFEAFADSRNSRLILLKDVSEGICAWADPVLRKRGYSRINALPIARLHIPATEDAYVEGLSANMRSNLRRRLKRARNLRVEVRTTTDGIDAELSALRAQTMARASTDYDVFEEISPDYYRQVLRNLGDNARLLTYWLGEDLVGFSMVLIGSNRLVQTYNGMRYPEGPDNGLFYLDWMTQIRLCLERGIKELQAGVTTYLIKARLGCVFHRNYVYVRHRSPVLNAITKVASPFINLEKGDPGLAELGASAPYV